MDRRLIELSRPGTIAETVDTVTVRVLNNFALVLNKHDVSLTPSIKKYGFWESWITSWFTENVEPGMNMLDIGANCGYYTMLFNRLSETGKVMAYEASGYYTNLLMQTRAINDANFGVRNVALSDAPGTITLSYPGEYTGSASIIGGFDPKWGELTDEQVSATTLDSELEAGIFDSVDMVKIDAESAEELIWNGGHNLWGTGPVVVLEYSPTGTYSKDFDMALFDYGKVTRINYDGREEPIEPDWLKGLKDWDMLVLRKG